MFALFNHEIPRMENEMEKQIGDFEFDFELDIEENDFETFEMPEIFLGRYMHDFKVKKLNIELQLFIAKLRTQAGK